MIPTTTPSQPYLDSDVYSFVTGSESTISNNPGLGRTTDRFISAAARLLERSVLRKAPRGRDRGLPPHSPSSSSIISLSLVSDSDSTQSGNVGVGRTMDKAVSAVGTRLEKFLSGVGERRLGLGPHALVGRILRSVDWEDNGCPSCRDAILRESDGFLGSWTTSVVSVEKVTNIAIDTYCRECRDRHTRDLLANEGFRKGCEKLVKSIRGGTPSVKASAIDYVSALACFHPEFQHLFLTLGADRLIEQVRAHSNLFGNETLLASSRRALCCLTDVTVIPLIKEFDALQDEVSAGASELRFYLSARRFSAVLPRISECVEALATHAMHPDHQILALLRLASFLKGGTFWTVLTGLESSISAQMVHELWCRLAMSKDALVRRVISHFLRVLYECGHGLSMRPWSFNRQAALSKPPWSWRCLWLPLFMLKVDFPQIYSKIPGLLLHDVCKGFTDPHTFTMRMGNQTMELRRQKGRVMGRIEGKVVSKIDSDPVMGLLEQMTSPLADIASDWHKEAGMFAFSFMCDIPRMIPEGSLVELCERLDDVLRRPDIPLESIRDFPLHDIAPWYDQDSRSEIWYILEQFIRDDRLREAIQRVLPTLRSDMADNELMCPEIVMGVVEPENGPWTNKLELYNEHYRWPYPSGRRYVRNNLHTHLVAVNPLRDLRWIPLSELSLMRRRLEPMVIPFNPQERKQYIGCFRDGNHRMGRLFRLNDAFRPVDEYEEGDLAVLHVLAVRKFGLLRIPPVYWMTRGGLIHAVTGHGAETGLDPHVALRDCRCYWPGWNYRYEVKGK
ncbi:hypothetical protein JAAARDRAFT_62657 [Jaapia argillacea MUCL 33604]|uniref:Uncharacterized protein n=1 Tax=Jaapia argillacea MUCL 33604 TaxID=933084 RepID=A0A067P8L7_9AGAM|nr:hypothetical protein JAAARDRAFT_62657 [Jaapia argillacea MUCL 33604]